jgi:hypothetical protein
MSGPGVPPARSSRLPLALRLGLGDDGLRLGDSTVALARLLRER